MKHRTETTFDRLRRKGRSRSIEDLLWGGEKRLAPCGEPAVPGHWFCSQCKTHYTCRPRNRPVERSALE